MSGFRFTKIKRRPCGTNLESRNCGFVITILLPMLLNAVAHCGPVNSRSDSPQADGSKVRWITDELTSTEGDFAGGTDQGDDDSYAELLNLINQLKLYEDEEEMQGDEPFSVTPSNQTSNNSATNEDIERLKKDKASHVKYIMDKFKNFFPDRFRGNVSTLLSKNFSRLLESCASSLNPVSSGSIAPSKTEVLPPSCSAPEYSLEDDRSSNKDLSFYFSFGNSSSNEQALNVSTMTLRLYKLPTKKQSKNQDRNFGTITSKPFEVTTSSSDPKKEDKKINVTVYYKRQTSKKKVEKVKVDSRVLNANDENITEWNILQASEIIQKKDGFSFIISVRDEEGHHLPAKQFFNTFDCSKPNELPKTLPFFIMECIKRKNSLSEDDKKYIDRIIKLPTLEILYWTKPNSKRGRFDGLTMRSLYDNATDWKSRKHETAKTTTKEPPLLSQNLSTKFVTK